MVPAVVLALFGTTVVGCSGGDSQESAQPAPLPRLPVSHVCPGLFEGEGEKALERVLASTQFQIRHEEKNPDVRVVAQAMEDAYQAGKEIRDMPQPVCEMSGRPTETGLATARMMFTAYSKHAGDPADFPGVSDSGVRVAMEQKRVYLSYDCVSSRVGSTQEIPLRIKLLFQERWDASKGEDVLRPDYLTITHSAALAVAKELRCANDGGLPARAVDLSKS
ncbi:hypothetical protein AB0892_20765 [Streptomyces sp. NPDC005409]|uniref:hypothetical protein n=1 Tax=Streptomyces sp. NPDC005409 TaxID=3155342 RepID=UPI003453FE70